MGVKRIYLDIKDCRFDNGLIFITGDTFHYLARVLRMGRGDVFSGFDGTGKEYLVELGNCEKKHITGTITSSHEISQGELPFGVNVFQSLPRGNKMDFIVRELSQLGVKKIVPVVSRRVIGPLSKEKVRARGQRWKKIAAASSGVSGRQFITEVENCRSFTEAFSAGADFSILFWEGERKFLRDILKSCPAKESLSVNIFIGPEGGFEDEEVEYARCHGSAIASLGSRILKVETASVVASALTIYELENREASTG